MAVNTKQVQAAYPNRRLIRARGRRQVIVMAKDIRGAVRSDPTACPFAKACIRQVEGVQEVIINKSTAYLVFENKIEMYRVVPSMGSEIVSFDRSGIFAEGIYNLGPAPKKQEDTDHGRERPTGKNKAKPIPSATRHRTIMVRGA
jgi:hypothetical protein